MMQQRPTVDYQQLRTEVELLLLDYLPVRRQPNDSELRKASDLADALLALFYKFAKL